MSVSYLFSVHIPILQSDDPVVAIVREESSAPLVVTRISKIDNRDFRRGILGKIEAYAEGIAGDIDKVPHIRCRFLFTGRAYDASAIDHLMAGVGWTWEAYAYATVTPGAGEGRLVSTRHGDHFHPINRFTIPRGALISIMNLIYSSPGMALVMMEQGEAATLQEELSAFGERSVKVSSSDPVQLMEHAGEGRVIAMGAGLWYAMKARHVVSEWTRDGHQI